LATTSLASTPHRTIEQACTNAAEHNVAANFDVADALALANDPSYDTVIDSALFHIFDV